jgi:aspartyl/asparaginyl-tRNA synthetase
MRQNDDGKTVAAMDLLVPGVGELIGAASGRRDWINCRPYGRNEYAY